MDLKSRFNLNEDMFIQYLDVFDEGVLIADMDGVIVYYNEALSKLDELSSSSVVGKHMMDAYDLRTLQSPTLKCIKTRKPVLNNSTVYKTIKGKAVNANQSAFPLVQDDEMTGCICFVRVYPQIKSGLMHKGTMHEKKIEIPFEASRFQDIITNDPYFIDTLDVLMNASQSPSPIMLCGETGTGKELVAKAIHNNCEDRKQFIAVNCSAIPENLLEGMLFGTTKGAFTGAVDKPGLFEEANGGTLLLDEIDSMPLELQAKILRVLQDFRVRRVGGSHEIRLDIKVISTVHNLPEQLFDQGLLRKDLYYRLAVVFEEIIPLRQRKKDIKLLCNFFIKKMNMKLGRQIETLNPELMMFFTQYHWPGNVRELEHILEGAMNRASPMETQLETRHLPRIFKRNISIQEEEFLHHRGKDDWPEGGIRKIQDQTEEKAIRLRLEQTHGNASRAAELLGISRQSLAYKLKKHNIQLKAYK
ncbi:sigma-54 interaction domain-containing protein [Desulforhopalus singaporensis]|uniref:Arginine utilization regulatory protein n=1 Tax=Desulforhopalus singaporensis TaxID=91360 RepID=A0A1H0R6F1_9BACT|nr:sigma 54-interacting transcriptional regulator [Desulforhopalus singaporensis]SDP25122.1 arginine utilization regulatory protein [Desulforhopalus singaporensis]